ncbi:MAG: hypothetical protein IJH76_03850 [Clostridia bacterium]|nr:hypothetical protein [Clostridia bacterium]
MNEKLCEKVAGSIEEFEKELIVPTDSDAIKDLKKKNLEALSSVIESFLKSKKFSRKAIKVTVETSKVFFSRKYYEYAGFSRSPFINIVFSARDTEMHYVDSHVLEFPLILDSSIFEVDPNSPGLGEVDLSIFDCPENFSNLQVFYTNKLVRNTFNNFRKFKIEFKL